MRRKVTEIPGTSVDVARSTSIESSLEINHVSWGLFPWPLLLLTISIDYLYWLSQKYRLTKCGMTWIHAPWHLAAQLSNVEISTLANPTMNHPSIQAKQPQRGRFQIIQNNMCITGIAYSWIYLTRTLPGINTISNSIHDSLLKDRDGFHGGDLETAMHTSENLRNLPARNGSEWWFQRKKSC